MTTLDKSETIIQELAGCGPFQFIMVICVFFLTRTPVVFSMLFMMFGNYNPGWRCLDINTTASEITHQNVFKAQHSGSSNTSRSDSDNDNNNENMNYNDTPGDFMISNCQVFESCNLIEFSQDASTIISEWGLLCNKKWIPSLIISLQMTGVLIGSSFAGYIADALGRKTAIYFASGGVAFLNIISIFSTSWEMFAALRFLLGICLAFILTLYFVYTAEFVTVKWRGLLIGIPEWAISSVLLSIVCMWLKDWRHIHIITAALCVIGLIPVLWLPESLRWLEVKNKKDRFNRAAEKILKRNGKTSWLPQLNNIQDVFSLNSDPIESTKTYYNYLDLFRKGYRTYTLLLSLPWFSVSVVSYVTAFGVKALYGDFYINMIIANGISIPFTAIPLMLPNMLGRKISGLLFCGTIIVLLLAAACFDKLASENLKTVGVLVCFFATKAVSMFFWSVVTLDTVEIYPTVVRGLSTSWGYTVSRVGGIVAPFLIPNEEETFFISYIVIGILFIVSFSVLLKLPETKGKRLQETFEQNENI